MQCINPVWILIKTKTLGGEKNRKGKKERRKERKEGRKEGRKEERKKERKEGRKKERKQGRKHFFFEGLLLHYREEKLGN